MHIRIVLFLLCCQNFMLSQVNDEILSTNFIKSVSFWNGEPNIYLLINYKNSNTNFTHEICLEKSELENALTYENSISHEDASTLLMNTKSRNFEFKNADAINILNRYCYSDKERDEFKSNIDFTTLYYEIKNNKNWFLELDKLKFNENFYAYYLTKSGYIISITYQCFGVNGLWCVSCQDE